MRTIPLLLTAAASLALAGGAAQAQQSWGPKHTTFWNSDATGRYAPNQFMPGPEAQIQYNAPQAKTGAPTGQAPVRPGRTAAGPPRAQPPSDVRPSAPPSGQPMQYRQPGQAPK